APPADDQGRRGSRASLRADRKVAPRRVRLGPLLPGLPCRRGARGRGLEDFGDQGGATRRRYLRSRRKRMTIRSTSLVSLALVAVALAAAPRAGAADQPRAFELRTYTAAPGKMDALNTRFREHTVELFKKH